MEDEEVVAEKNFFRPGSAKGVVPHFYTGMGEEEDADGNDIFYCPC